MIIWLHLVMSSLVSFSSRVLGKRSVYAPRGVRAMAVDSKEFLKTPQKNIPADEMFLYQ